MSFTEQVEHFRQQVLELQGKCDILENQNKTIGESYQNVIRTKDVSVADRTPVNALQINPAWTFCHS